MIPDRYNLNSLKYSQKSFFEDRVSFELLNPVDPVNDVQIKEIRCRSRFVAIVRNLLNQLFCKEKAYTPIKCDHKVVYISTKETVHFFV